MFTEIPPEMEYQTTIVRLPIQLHMWLRTLAFLRKTSMSKIMVEALEQYKQNIQIQKPR